MAKCKIIGEPEYVLTLTKEEAMALDTLIGKTNFKQRMDACGYSIEQDNMVSVIYSHLADAIEDKTCK